MLYSVAMDELTALADRTRRRIIGRLRMGPKSVEQIAKSMKVSRPAVSQGLKVLLESGLVKRESRGRQAFYSLCGRGLVRLREWVEGLEIVLERYGNKEPDE
jgi:DNA-binding transcriptional ArsR family regulator